MHIIKYVSLILMWILFDVDISLGMGLLGIHGLWLLSAIMSLEFINHALCSVYFAIIKKEQKLF